MRSCLCLVRSSSHTIDCKQVHTNGDFTTGHSNLERATCEQQCTARCWHPCLTNQPWYILLHALQCCTVSLPDHIEQEW
jgi:hypothetical protein